MPGFPDDACRIPQLRPIASNSCELFDHTRVKVGQTKGKVVANTFAVWSKTTARHGRVLSERHAASAGQEPSSEFSHVFDFYGAAFFK